jgi:PIN domain nuclease of toxin-antitoxin system
VSRYLLDTNALIWIVGGSDNVGAIARDLIDSSDALATSVCSLWEVAIKHGNGKFNLSADELSSKALEVGVQILPLELKSIRAYSFVRLQHKDPFDRMIVSVCLSEGMKLLTSDKLILEGFEAAVDVTK